MDMVVNYEPLNFETDFGGEIKTTVLRLANEYQVIPLQLVWRDYGKNRPLQLHIHYRIDFFQDKEIEFLADRLLFILEQFPEKIDEPIDSLNILPPSEKDLIQNFNNTETDFIINKTVVGVFEDQVLKTPTATVVVFEGEELSYSELNARANQLANYLRIKGVKEDTLVPVCIERSLDMLVAILGILKAGAAYVPIDTDFPAERIAYMLAGYESTTSSEQRSGPFKTSGTGIRRYDI